MSTVRPRVFEQLGVATSLAAAVACGNVSKDASERSVYGDAPGCGDTTADVASRGQIVRSARVTEVPNCGSIIDLASDWCGNSYLMWTDCDEQSSDPFRSLTPIVARLDRELTVAWQAKATDATHPIVLTRQLAGSPVGAIATGMSFSDRGTAASGWIREFASTSAPLWAGDFNVQGASTIELAEVTRDHDLLVAGSSAAPPPGPFAWVRRFDDARRVEWTVEIGVEGVLRSAAGASGIEAVAIWENDDETLTVVGTESPWDVETSRAWRMKLSASGERVWLHRDPVDAVRSVVSVSASALPDGGFVSLEQHWDVRLDPGVRPENYLVRYDGSGQQVWSWSPPTICSDQHLLVRGDRIYLLDSCGNGLEVWSTSSGGEDPVLIPLYTPDDGAALGSLKRAIWRGGNVLVAFTHSDAGSVRILELGVR